MDFVDLHEICEVPCNNYIQQRRRRP